MLQAGVEPERIYQDLASGRHDARPGLVACLKALQSGNTLVLWRLDRLGRDLKHLVNTAEDLRVRGVGLKVLAGAGAQVDTTTANGRLAFGIFAAFAEFERELIAERTQAGLKAARARGRMGGRPRKMDRATLSMAMAAMSNPKSNATKVAKRLGLTTTTLYAYVNGDGSPKAAGQALRQRNDPSPYRVTRQPLPACDARGGRCAGRGAYNPAAPPCGAAGASSRACGDDGVHGAALCGEPCHAAHRRLHPSRSRVSFTRPGVSRAALGVEQAPARRMTRPSP